MKYICFLTLLILSSSCTVFERDRIAVDLTVYEQLVKENDSLRLRVLELEKENLTFRNK